MSWSISESIYIVPAFGKNEATATSLARNATANAILAADMVHDALRRLPGKRLFYFTKAI